jgi:hypothetical protein
MDDTNTQIAIVSIIVSGIIALSSLIAPLLVNFFSDSAKWKREKLSLQKTSLDEKTNKLLELLSAFLSGNVADATGQRMDKIRKEIIGTYYVWEREIWSLTKENEKTSIKELRSSFEKADHRYLYTDGSKLADTIINHSYRISQRIK